MQIRPMEEVEQRTLDELREEPPSLVESFDRAEMADLVRGAVSRLPDEYQLIFRLRYWVGMSVKDLAAFLSLPISTAKWKLTRGRKLFIKTYRELEGEEKDDT